MTTTTNTDALAATVGDASVPLLTPTAVFAMRDTLADKIRVAGHNIAADTADDIAEALMTESLIAVGTLLGLTESLAGGRIDGAEALDRCSNGSCDGPKGHPHGTECGPLCTDCLPTPRARR